MYPERKSWSDWALEYEEKSGDSLPFLDPPWAAREDGWAEPAQDPGSSGHMNLGAPRWERNAVKWFICGQSILDCPWQRRDGNMVK